MEENNLIFGTGASACKDQAGLYNVICRAVECGIRRFDTAPSYKTEELLGGVLHQLFKQKNLKREDFYIQTKIDAWQMQESDGNIESYVESALKKMQLEYFDALLIHWPIPEYFDSTWQNFIKLFKTGICKKIGICNVRMWNMEKIINYEILPHIIQIERHPLRNCYNEVEFCKSNGIEIQAYSPLCKMDIRIKDNLVLREIAEKHKKSIGQIVLKWHIQSDVIPIFTSKKTERISEYTDLDNLFLSDEEMNKISSLNINHKMYLESWVCPGL